MDPIKAKIIELCPDVKGFDVRVELQEWRCVLSEKGRQRNVHIPKKCKSKTGKVIGETRNRKGWQVVWDGCSPLSKCVYEKDLLEPSVDNSLPITLAVVLRAIENKYERAPIAGDAMKIKCLKLWNLSKDNYDDQTEETKRFIGSLLGV